MKTERVSLQKKCVGIQPTYLSKPNKIKLKTKMMMFKEQHNCAWNNKNEVFGRKPEIFIDEEGDALGIPKLWRLYFLDISWGDTRGIPKLEL